MNNSRHLFSASRWPRRLIASENAFYLGTAATVFFFYFSILLLFSRTLLDDPDTFWHIRTGQWILDHAQFPTVDFFSYTAAGKPWIATEWLSEIFFATAFKFGGWHAVVVLAAASLFRNSLGYCVFTWYGTFDFPLR